MNIILFDRAFYTAVDVVAGALGSSSLANQISCFSIGLLGGGAEMPIADRRRNWAFNFFGHSCNKAFRP